MFVKNIDKYPDGLLDQIFTSEKMEYTEEIRENLETAISNLPEIEKQLIILRFKDKKLIQEIGEMMNISQGTTSYRIQTAVGKLKHPVIKKQIRGNSPSTAHQFALENFSFSIRTYNALRRNGIRSMEQIESIKQLNKMRNVGKMTIKEIIKVAKENGLYIRP